MRKGVSIFLKELEPGADWPSGSWGPALETRIGRQKRADGSSADLHCIYVNRRADIGGGESWCCSLWLHSELAGWSWAQGRRPTTPLLFNYCSLSPPLIDPALNNLPPCWSTLLLALSLNNTATPSQQLCPPPAEQLCSPSLLSLSNSDYSSQQRRLFAQQLA